MCNLYSETKGQDAIRGLFRTAHDRTGNLPAFPGIFPDQLAPIVRNNPDSSVRLTSTPAGRRRRFSMQKPSPPPRHLRIEPANTIGANDKIGRIENIPLDEIQHGAADFGPFRLHIPLNGVSARSNAIHH